MRRYLINKQIYFDMAILAARQEVAARFKWLKDRLMNRDLRLDTIRTGIEMMRDLRDFRSKRVFKKCWRARP